MIETSHPRFKIQVIALVHLLRYRPPVLAFRFAFLGAGPVNRMQLLYSFGFMVVIVIVGITIFNRVEQTFMDTV